MSLMLMINTCEYYCHRQDQEKREHTVKLGYSSKLVEVLVSILGDDIRLRQIWFPCLHNFFKHISPPSILVQVLLESHYSQLGNIDESNPRAIEQVWYIHVPDCFSMKGRVCQLSNGIDYRAQYVPCNNKQ